MFLIDFMDCTFHDATIENIIYDKSKLIFNISNLQYNDSNVNAIMQVQIDNFDIDIFIAHRYYSFGKARFKGERMCYEKLKELFESGFVLRINEVCRSFESILLIFECSVFPYMKQKGKSKEVFIRLNQFTKCELNYISKDKQFS